jgi:hypothetical protein
MCRFSSYLPRHVVHASIQKVGKNFFKRIHDKDCAFSYNRTTAAVGLCVVYCLPQRITPVRYALIPGLTHSVRLDCAVLSSSMSVSNDSSGTIDGDGVSLSSTFLEFCAKVRNDDPSILPLPGAPFQNSTIERERTHGTR